MQVTAETCEFFFIFNFITLTSTFLLTHMFGSPQGAEFYTLSVVDHSPTCWRSWLNLCLSAWDAPPDHPVALLPGGAAARGATPSQHHAALPELWENKLQLILRCHLVALRKKDAARGETIRLLRQLSMSASLKAELSSFPSVFSETRGKIYLKK